MIMLRYRTWDFEEWTWISLEGPAEEDAVSVFGGWAMSQGMDIERKEDPDDWIPLGEES